MKHYETVVIGAGPGGYEAALHLGNAGVKTLLVDKSREHIGGTCLNEGCISSKAYLQSAHYMSKASSFGDFGIAEVQVRSLDMNRLREKTRFIKDELRSGVLWLLEEAGVELLYGFASFVDVGSIEVSGERISFDKCIIATGSQAREVPLAPLDGKRIISSRELFELDVLPSSITILGGGAIGCEFATFFNAFGVEVTLILRGSRLLSNEDEDVSKELLRAFKKRNINVITSASLQKAEVKQESVGLLIEAEGEKRIVSELLLCATGRIPYTQGLNIEKTGIELDEKGFIKVDASFQTSQKQIYAVGDCINTLAYAHTAYAEGRIAADNIISKTALANTHNTPSVIFTDPEIASCGLKERDAKVQGRAIEVKKAFFKVNAKAKIEGDDSGFLKLILCAQSGVILGAALIGAEATELIHEMVLAVEKELTLKELKEMIHAHPTLSEIFRYI